MHSGSKANTMKCPGVCVCVGNPTNMTLSNPRLPSRHTQRQTNTRPGQHVHLLAHCWKARVAMKKDRFSEDSSRTQWARHMRERMGWSMTVARDSCSGFSGYDM